MHINAFVPTENVVMVGSSVDAKQIPFTSFALPPLGEERAHQLTAPILLCVWTEKGIDNDPHFYVQARDPQGEVRGNVELAWIWEDEPDRPFKWRVFDLTVPFLVFDQGVYNFGVYADRNDSTGDALASFPFLITFDSKLPPLPPMSQGLPPGAEYA